jgi:hypothetical protein
MITNRNYTSKNIDKVCNRFRNKESKQRLSRKEARELLDKYKFMSKIPGYKN